MDSSQVVKLLQAARHAVDEANLPELLQPAAFAIAVDLLARQTPNKTNDVPKATDSVTGSRSDSDAGEVTSAQPASSILASALGLAVEAIEEVFDFSGGKFLLHVPTSRLTGSKKETTQKLALLCVAGRIMSGMDPSTTATKEIREVGQHYGNKFDPANFARYLKQQDDEFRLVGSGRGATVKLTRQGQESAKSLIEQLSRPSGSSADAV
jgi:hypothetical protein